MKKLLAFNEFLNKLRQIHGEVYMKTWNNYPKSIFYYNTPNATTYDSEIGIYTSEENYYIKGET